MVKVVITAPRGNMDRLIVEAAHMRDDMEIIGGVGIPGRDYIGKDIGVAAGLGYEVGAPVYDDIGEIIDKCDVVVDFSTTDFSMEVLESCIEHGKALVCGTTGFSETQTERFTAAGESIAILKSANTSYVVNVMKKLLGEAAEKLADKCKIEMIEMHSESKKDAPSGTAIEFADEMSGRSSGKTRADIQIHSVRAGNTPSTHRIIFGCMGEKMEISHDAYDWRCYASGACDAAVFLADMKSGIYTMEDVIEA